MEILFVVFAYLLHCFTAFALIYSCDEAKIWGDVEEKKLTMPNLDDFKIDETEWDYKHKRDEYIEKTICPAHHYFLLRRELQWYQSDCDKGLGYGLFLQIFSLIFLSQMLINGEFIDSWIIAILISLPICSISCFIMYWIYHNYWRCQGIRIKHFNYEQYENCSNNYLIEKHYTYLNSIKETVYFRASVRKILFNASLIIYILFFFSIPE